MSRKYYYDKSGRRYLGKVGRPKTGWRVHWLIWMLPKVLRGYYDIYSSSGQDAYKITYKDDTKRRERYDEYIIIRTSSKCYRVMYHDHPTATFEYTSYKNVYDVVDYILYRLPKKLELEQAYKEDQEIKRLKRLLNRNRLKKPDGK